MSLVHRFCTTPRGAASTQTPFSWVSRTLSLCPLYRAEEGIQGRFIPDQPRLHQSKMRKTDHFCRPRPGRTQPSRRAPEVAKVCAGHGTAYGPFGFRAR